MPKKPGLKQVPVKYTSRDFRTIKSDLVDYAKRYYPDTFKDFSAASFGSLLLDTVAYAGDILSFYLDYQANESFLATSIEYDNILKHGQQVGYKVDLNPSSFGTLTLYALIPSREDGMGPDTNYMPILSKGSKFRASNGNLYTLNEDVNFAHPNNEIVVATTNSEGFPTSYAVKAYGIVQSGELFQEFIKVGSFQKYLLVPLADPNITEIVEVIDAEGHEYFEVPYLSHDTVFKPLINSDGSTNIHAPSILRAISVPRRFITKNERGVIKLQFGYGSDAELKTDSITHPSNIVMKRHGRAYDSEQSFDPSRLLSSDKFGISPSETTLAITYRANSTSNVNAPTNTVTIVDTADLRYGENAIDENIKANILESIECTNDNPINGGVLNLSPEELRERVNVVFSSQNRAVTAEDYKSLTYQMPSKFGKVKRCSIVRDHDSFKRNLNMYVLAEGFDGKFETANSVVKNNLKNWINQYKMINDTIDILDGRIVNLKISFIAVAQLGLNKYDVLNICLTTLKDYFVEKMDLGQSLYVTDIYSILNSLDEVADVADVNIFNKVGGVYSDVNYDLNANISSDGRIIFIPESHVFEIKFPDADIQGTIK